MSSNNYSITEAKEILKLKNLQLERNGKTFKIFENNECVEKDITRSSLMKKVHSFALEFEQKGIVVPKIKDSSSTSKKAKTKKAKTKKLKTGEPVVASTLKQREEALEKQKNNGNTSNIVNIEDVIENHKSLNYDISIPTEYKGYYFPKIAKPILRRLEYGRNCFISGDSGTGKTEFVAKLADLIEQKVVRVNFNVGTNEQHLIGKWIVKNGQTEFIYGILPLAMKNGWWILFDEIDYAMPEHLAVLQPVLEGNSLLITQNNNEEIIPHTNFRIFATANTKGRGDETQSYVGTGYLNLAFLDRWAIFELDYTNKEPEIVNNIIQEEKLTKQIIQYFKMLRKASEEGTILNAVFSTRRLIFLAEALLFGESLSEALNHEIFSRYDKHESDIMREMAYDIWDREHYFKRWYLGDEHYVNPNTQQENNILQEDNEMTQSSTD